MLESYDLLFNVESFEVRDEGFLLLKKNLCLVLLDIDFLFQLVPVLLNFLESFWYLFKWVSVCVIFQTLDAEEFLAHVSRAGGLYANVKHSLDLGFADRATADRSVLDELIVLS